MDYPSDKARKIAYEQQARERKEALEQEERERLAKVEYIAKLGTGRPTLRAKSFTELGDILTREGYQMHKARKLDGVTMVPHQKKGRAVLEVRGL